MSSERGHEQRQNGRRESEEKVGRREPPKFVVAEADRGDKLGFSPNAKRAFDLNLTDSDVDVPEREPKKGE